MSYNRIMFGLFKKKSFKYTFLIVDDDKDILEVLEDRLKDIFDAKINCFTNKKEFLESLLSSNKLPDLILADINLKEEKSGLSVMSDLKQHNFDIPIIFISGLAGEDLNESKYIVLGKPIDFKKLEEKIKSIL